MKATEIKINALVNPLGLEVSEIFSQSVRLQQIGTDNYFELYLYTEVDYEKFDELYDGGLSKKEAMIQTTNFNVKLSTPCLEMGLFSEQIVEFVKSMSDFVSNESLKNQIQTIMIQYFWNKKFNK